MRLADLHCVHTPNTYAYLFEWTPPLLGARIGACHGLEIPFVFDTMRHPVLRPLWGSTRSAYRLARRMQTACVRFARSDCQEHAELPEWPSYIIERRSSMSLGSECMLRDDPHERARSFWGEIIADARLPWSPVRTPVYASDPKMRGRAPTWNPSH